MEKEIDESKRVWLMVYGPNGRVNTGSVEGYTTQEEVEAAILPILPYYRGYKLQLINRADAVVHERIL